MHLLGAYRGLPRPSSASEPSYPPDGVVYRVYWKSPVPKLRLANPLHGDHREMKLTAPFIKETCS